jgi:hypothetical protein
MDIDSVLGQPLIHISYLILMSLNVTEEPAAGCGPRETMGEWQLKGLGQQAPCQPGSGTSPFGGYSVPLSLGLCIC